MRARDIRLGNGQLIDSMVHDGLWDIYNDYHMGITGENVAEKYGITREEQDEFAVNSHRKAIAAQKECRFKAQIVPVELPAKKKGQAPVIFDKDEGPREDTTIEDAARAEAGVQERWDGDGGECSGSERRGGGGGGDERGAGEGTGREADGSDRRAGDERSRAEVGDDGSGGRGAEDLAEDGWKKDDVDLYELNEAFSVQALGVIRELGLDMDRVNVNGGAVALGHPIGASGARVLVTLIYEMIRRDVHRGIAALCLGGGNAVAMAVER